jgi:hypothetical protein
VTARSSSRLARFRQNEILRAFAGELAGPFAFQCECSDSRCGERLLVEAADIGAVRANARRLVMAIGHSADEEHVVLEYDSYVVVELA